MEIYLCISIDVEPDCSPNWLYSSPLAFRSVSHGIAAVLHPLFDEFGIKPTYLINNVVLEDDESVAVFKSLGKQFELGTHLHGDFIEPGKVHTDYAGKDGLVNQCYLEPAIEYGKLKNLTSLFVNRFGYSPVSFRAGRFSAGKNTIRSLAELGYKVDTSVTPNVTWDDFTRERPVDFRAAPNQPYWTDQANFPQPSIRKSLLQVPVSIVTKRKFFLLKRPFWLRPYYSDTAGMIKVMNKLVHNNRDKQIVVLNMMFHNVEVMPGLSPYCQSNTDVARYLDSIRYFFEYCLNMNVRSATLSDIYGHYQP